MTTSLTASEITKLTAILLGEEPKRAATRDAAAKRFEKVAAAKGLTSVSLNDLNMLGFDSASMALADALNGGVPVSAEKLADIAKHERIDADLADNREAMKDFHKGDIVQWNNPSFYADGSGKLMRGEIVKISSKEQGIFEIKLEDNGPTVFVGARLLNVALVPMSTNEETGEQEQAETFAADDDVPDCVPEFLRKGSRTAEIAAVMPEPVPTAAKPARKAKAEKPAVEAGEKPAIRPGSKKALILDMLLRPEGATEAEVCEALVWKAAMVTMRRVAEAAGVTLRAEKVKGEKTRYFGSKAEAAA